jgi:hypothetical protein
MRMKQWLAGSAVGLAMTLVATAAGAAPAGAGLGAANSEPATSAVEKVYWTYSCWYHRGHRHCGRRWVEPRHFAPRFYFHSGPRFRHYGHRSFRRH